MLTASHISAKCAIYIHWPFCLKKCPYCDFNSHVRDHVDAAAWQRAMLDEIDHFKALFPNLQASSIFFGGGTPSLMPPETTAAIIEQVSSHWGNGDDIEITLEANPSSVEAGRFQNYKQAGVNRISIGVQSLRDDALKFLGRLHNVSEAMTALDVARNIFDHVSFDLIYARPNMTLANWKTELSEALAMNPSHLSLYQLTIEEGTAFDHQFRRGRFTLPDEEHAAALLTLTREMTLSAGLPAYEISNHAKPGAESQHNLAYWQGDFYMGIGPGAHGRLPSNTQGAAQAHGQISRPENWLAAVNKKGLGLESFETIDPKDRAVEALMMGLRLTKGIDLKAFQARFGVALHNFLDPVEVEKLSASGHIAQENGFFTLTPSGVPLLNYLLGRLLA